MTPVVHLLLLAAIMFPAGFVLAAIGDFAGWLYVKKLERIGKVQHEKVV